MFTPGPSDNLAQLNSLKLIEVLQSINEIFLNTVKVGLIFYVNTVMVCSFHWITLKVKIQQMSLSRWSAAPPWWHEWKTASGATPMQYVLRFVQSHCDERLSHQENRPPECGSAWVSRQQWLSLSLSIHHRLTCLSLSLLTVKVSPADDKATASVGRRRVCNWIPRPPTCSSSAASHQSRSRWGGEERRRRGENVWITAAEEGRDKRHESGLIIVPELQHHSSLLSCFNRKNRQNTINMQTIKGEMTFDNLTAFFSWCLSIQPMRKKSILDLLLVLPLRKCVLNDNAANQPLVMSQKAPNRCLIPLSVFLILKIHWRSNGASQLQQ